jgi:hypothetical protein
MKTRKSSRRDFLGSTLAGGAGLAAGAAAGGFFLNPRLLRAGDESGPSGGQPKDHYFIFYYFPGGWDILLSWDPRDPEVFTQANMGETGIYPAYSMLTVTPKHGMYIDTELGKMGGFVGDLRLKKYTDKLCVIRGVNMETLSHNGGFLRFRTGRMPEGSVPTRDSSDVVLSTLLGNENLVPNVSLGVTSINNGSPGYASPLGAKTTDDISKSMFRGNVLAPPVEAEIQALLNQQAGCNHAVASKYLVKANETKATVETMLKSPLSGLTDFTAQTAFAESMRSHYGFAKNQLGSVEALTALAEVVITKQASRCVSIRVPGSSLGSNAFDTHYSLEQGPEQMKAYNAIARLIDHLETAEFPGGSGDSWLDHTTIMCFSEFSRSPLLEYGVGRGHWLNNACVIAGGGFKTNQVIGKSSDIGMTPRPVDLKTGEVLASGGDMITPDHIMRTVYTMLGYENDVADLRVEPLQALLKNG